MPQEAIEAITSRRVESVSEVSGALYTYPVTFVDKTTITITDVSRCIGHDDAILSFTMNGKQYCATFVNEDLKRVIRVRSSKRRKDTRHSHPEE
jgi:hypothetical protein